MSDPHRQGQPPWPEQYNRPGETEWIPRVTDAPRRDEPFRFQEDKAPGPRTSPALTWVLRVAGLVAVAVVSGLVWAYIQSDTPPAEKAEGESTQPVDGVYQFTAHPKVAQPLTDDKCAEHAYGDIQKFLQKTPCDQVVQGLYTTTADGKQIMVSVSVVRMTKEADAEQLRKLTDTENTGNVNDLVKEGVVQVSGLTSLAGNDGYHAVQQGKNVIIVEADFVVDSKRYKGDKKSEELLDAVCTDAIRLGESFGKNS